MNKYTPLLLLSLSLLLFVQCAKRGTPTGGAKDSIPPVVVRASPDNFSTNFDKEEIRIHFNEFVKLEKPQEQIIISPPMSPQPEISPMGTARKYVAVKMRDTLQENTTYVINFGRSIVDNNESNPLPFYKYIFSTGSYIDSLSVSGQVKDAILKEPEPFISVMLYERDEKFSDSLVFKEPPRYITNTLDTGKTFQITNLKEGRYQLLALKDRNNNYRYDPYAEKIGFIDRVVTIPADTTYTLLLFREQPPFRPERPKQLGRQKLLIGYRGKPDFDSLQFKALSGVPENFEHRITKVKDKDSLHFWFKPRLEADTLKLALESPKRSDTLIVRLTDMQADTLSITVEPSGNIEFREDIIFRGSTPLVSKNEEFISLLDKDSVAVPFTAELRKYENSLRLRFEKKENEAYSVTALPGALTDFYGAINDTLIKNLRTRPYSDYGNITVNLQNVKSFPVIVQLTTETGEVKTEQYLTGGETRLRFQHVLPGKYRLRAIYDRNENGRWDTGNYLEKRQPEEVIYFPDILELRANWDVNQSFGL